MAWGSRSRSPLVAAAGLVTATFKHPTDTTPDVTTIGFVAGSGIALGAAAGQVAVPWLALEQAGIGTLALAFLTAGGLASFALLTGPRLDVDREHADPWFGGQQKQAREKAAGHDAATVRAAGEGMIEAAAQSTVPHAAVAAILEQLSTDENPNRGGQVAGHDAAKVRAAGQKMSEAAERGTVAHDTLAAILRQLLADLPVDEDSALLSRRSALPQAIHGGAIRLSWMVRLPIDIGTRVVVGSGRQLLVGSLPRRGCPERA